MRILKLAALAAVVSFVVPVQVVAQSTATSARQPLGQSTAPPAVMEALLEDIAQAEAKLIALAEAIPEGQWGWRPGPGVRSVAEVLRHVAADNYFIPAFTGVAAPASTGIVVTSYPSVQAYEARELGRAETLAELRTSFEHLRRVMQAVDAGGLGATYDVFGTQMSGLALWVLTATHLHEHLGQMIAYARTNGVVPPWSRQSE